MAHEVSDREPDIEVAGEAADGGDAIAKVRRLEPDVALMDIRMPNLNGLEATRTLVADGSSTRILILTTFDVDAYVYEALRVGASGFLLKDASPEALIDAIHVVADGEALLDRSVTRRVIEEFARLPRAPEETTIVLEALTAREREVFDLLAHGLSNAEIARELVVTEATAKAHVAHVLTKLDLRDRVQAVVYAYESGFVRVGAAPVLAPRAPRPNG